jgi:hypothetical protein
MISRSNTAPPRCASYSVVGILCLLAGCEEPQPISFAEFMDDAIARDGTLARCNENREATAGDIECANARRAAAAIALREERARREALERESEQKLAALREELEFERAAAREAKLLAEAAARAAYDAQWESNSEAPVGIDGLPLSQGQAIGVAGLPIAVEDSGQSAGDDAVPGIDEPLSGAIDSAPEPEPGVPIDGSLEPQ